jgi:hypothetical protein
MFVGTEHSRVDGKINDDAHVVKAKHSTINLAVVVAAIPVVQAWAIMGADVAVLATHRLFVVNPMIDGSNVLTRCAGSGTVPVSDEIFFRQVRLRCIAAPLFVRCLGTW